MHFRNVKQMTSYLMFDVYRFSNMILANEHRSLGPIFNVVLIVKYYVKSILHKDCTCGISCRSDFTDFVK